MIGLLDYAFAVPSSGWADRDGAPVVLRDAGEASGHRTGVGVADRGHPVETPHSGDAAQRADNAIEIVDEMRLIHRRGQHCPPLA